MAVPIAIPIIAAIAAAGTAAARYGSEKSTAKGMMPEGWQDEKDRLEKLKASDQMGLDERELAELEQQGTMQRGGALADANARQLQQAQMMAGSGAVSGRDMYINEVTNQAMQQKALYDQSVYIQGLDAQAKAAQESMLFELQQREASAEAAKKAAKWQFIGGLIGAGGQAVSGIAGVNAGANANMGQMQNLALQQPVAQQQAAWNGMAMQQAQAFGPAPQPVAQQQAAWQQPYYTGY